MKKAKKTRRKHVKRANDKIAGQDAEREAILDEREKLRREFPAS